MEYEEVGNGRKKENYKKQGEMSLKKKEHSKDKYRV